MRKLVTIYLTSKEYRLLAQNAEFIRRFGRFPLESAQSATSVDKKGGQLRKLLVFLLVLLTACASASTDLSIGDIWARPGLAGGNSAAYFVVENYGVDDTLLSASSDIAEAVELHQTQMEGDQMHMQHMAHGVPIPAGGPTRFEPGGLHVMFIGLKQDLKVGDTFDLTLVFEQAGELTVSVTVQEP